MKLSDWLNQQRGRSQALADHLGVTPARVSQIATEDRVPQKHMRATSEFTAGEVSFEEMVPVSDEAKA